MATENALAAEKTSQKSFAGREHTLRPSIGGDGSQQRPVHIYQSGEAHHHTF
jgi:hypothetical protein